MSKRTSMMLEEEIKLHRFAGISPEQSFTEAGRHCEAVVAADQSMFIRCLGDDLARFVHDEFHGQPPSNAPVSAAAKARSLSNLVPAPAFQPMKIMAYVLTCAPAALCVPICIKL